VADMYEIPDRKHINGCTVKTCTNLFSFVVGHGPRVTGVAKIAQCLPGQILRCFSPCDYGLDFPKLMIVELGTQGPGQRDRRIS